MRAHVALSRCPCQHDSGGKQCDGGATKASLWLREALVKAAAAAARYKDPISRCRITV